MEVSILNGYKIKDKKAIRFYDTVQDMKDDTTLKEGMHVKTKGYYSLNDGGASEYHITATESLSDYQEELESGLYATLIIENIPNVKQFGAHGDNITDDTLFLQNAIDKCEKLIIPNGTYLTNGISLKSNSILISNNAILKMITNNLSAYRIIDITEKTNISIIGTLNLIGDKDTHTGDSGEWGMCMSIRGSNNIYIENVITSYAWGDGLHISDSTNIDNQYNIYINNLTCHHNRRNGLSIISGEKIRIDNIFTYSNGGTSPNGGFDIEPNVSTNKIDVSLGNVYCYDNLGISSVQCFISNAYTDNYKVNIDYLRANGPMSIINNNSKSQVNIKALNLTIPSTGRPSITLTSTGLINIGDFILDIREQTEGNIIYTENLHNCNIDNFNIIGGTYQPQFISNTDNTRLNIGYFSFNGELNTTNTNKCYIHVGSVIRRQKTLVTDNKTITPLLTDIIITEDITSISYNDIAQYDNWTFYITNNNETNDCTLSFNTREILLLDGTKSSTLSIPKDNIAKIRYDAISNIFILEYLI